MLVPQFIIPGLEERPDFWRVRPDEITGLCATVRKGRSEVIAITPGGFPVHAVFYGEFKPYVKQSNWSAGSASGRGDLYRPKDKRPTLLWCAGIHGAEAESVAASVNLIELLERGRDFLGRTHDELVERLKEIDLIILPCVNMDGRAISPDHLRQASFRDFRVASQGEWLDGRLVDWLGSKEYFPLPLDRVTHPGGYPNSEGYNIMHDASPGHFHTAEAAAILRLVDEYAVDLLLNGHSCEGGPVLLGPCSINYPSNIERSKELVRAVNAALFEAGLRDDPAPEMPSESKVNLNTLVPIISGGIALTLECTVSRGQSFEQIMDANFVTLHALLRHQPWRTV